MRFEESLKKASEIVELYESGEWIHEEKLRELLRSLSGCHYAITTENINAYKEHNTILYNHDGSVARANIEADNEVPQLRMSRKILESINHVLWSMRSELSIIKSEK